MLKAKKIGPNNLLIKNTNIVNVENGEILKFVDIVIKNDRIIKIGKEIQYSQNTKIIDATNKYVIPGLWDMHVHSCWDYKLHHNLFLANGVTGIREMWGEFPLINQLSNDLLVPHRQNQTVLELTFCKSGISSFFI